MKKTISILGSTGSIGTQTLDVIRRHRDRFEVGMLSAGSNAAALIEQALEFDPASVVICDESKYEEVAEALQPKDIKVFAGIDSACELVKADDVDIVVGAMVGFSGLRPTLSALEHGKTVALANKETLVAAGSTVIRTAMQGGGAVIPVDSEHSAIFQCLQCAGENRLQRIHLTASGGPFRTWDKSRMAGAKAADALKHPNWSMGRKVTIDSATMMNKGFEVIEAYWLFNTEPSDINVVVHPESVIHSMVEFADGAVIAQLGCPDMREPISYALGYPERLECGNKRLDFASLGSIHFEAPDLEKFPCLALAYESIRTGGNIPCALNAANEVAVAAFLEDRIGYYDIPRICEKVMEGTSRIVNPSLDDIFSTNEAAAAKAREMI